MRSHAVPEREVGRRTFQIKAVGIRPRGGVLEVVQISSVGERPNECALVRGSHYEPGLASRPEDELPPLDRRRSTHDVKARDLCKGSCEDSFKGIACCKDHRTDSGLRRGSCRLLKAIVGLAVWASTGPFQMGSVGSDSCFICILFRSRTVLQRNHEVPQIWHVKDRVQDGMMESIQTGGGKSSGAREMCLQHDS